MTIKRLITLLTWAGLIPFVGFAAIYLFGSWDGLVTPGYAIVSYAIYAAVILAFLAGSHWGLVLSRLDLEHQLPAPKTTLVLSNVIALVAWIGVAMQFKVIGLSLVLAGFLVQLWLDFKLRQRLIISGRYFSLRCWVTVVVVMTLIPVLLRLKGLI